MSENEIQIAESTHLSLEDELKHISKLPFIETTDLMHVAIYKGGKEENTQVPVDKIIGGLNIESWDKIARYRNIYISRMIEAIKSGELDLKKDPPSLIDWGGAYLVIEDGNTRCGVSKMMNLESIPAKVVTGITLDQLAVFSLNDYQVLLSKREQGMWSGSLEIVDYGSSSFYAKGKVEFYEGLWIFSKEPEKVKEIYQQIGASGKLT